MRFHHSGRILRARARRVPLDPWRRRLGMGAEGTCGPGMSELGLGCQGHRYADPPAPKKKTLNVCGFRLWVRGTGGGDHVFSWISVVNGAGLQVVMITCALFVFSWMRYCSFLPLLPNDPNAANS